MIQDTLKIGQKYSTVPRARERVSERSGARERIEQCGASEQVSKAEQTNESVVRANERTDERVAQYLRE